ncbi:hypothetical protein GCM10022288_18150 [Gryllotalpicola kribbensis]|uniref:SDR family oxidoreductase n=1 Tax=Gryllotalpicola kribbensis TaxID=993084 RepID=A0ABP8AT27_9MICO
MQQLLRASIAGSSAPASERGHVKDTFWIIGLILALEKRLSDNEARKKYLEIRGQMLDTALAQVGGQFPPEALAADPELSTLAVDLLTEHYAKLGAACATELASAGYRIAAMSPSGRGAALARELGGVGLDGSNRSVDDLQAVVDLAVTEYGRVDTVVNCSGHAAKGKILELTDQDWQDGLELYLLNVVRMARIVTPHLLEAGGGSIVNISTSSPFEPNPNYPVSATIRAGLASFTKLYADEHGPRGIRVDGGSSRAVQRGRCSAGGAHLCRCSRGACAGIFSGRGKRALVQTAAMRRPLSARLRVMGDGLSRCIRPSS